jgi:hypothetical protein
MVRVLEVQYKDNYGHGQFNTEMRTVYYTDNQGRGHFITEITGVINSP